MNPIIREGTTGEPIETAPRPEEALAQARARRLAALKAAEGMWADRTDIPLDGVKAQEQLRREWR